MDTKEAELRESVIHQHIGVDEYGYGYYMWKVINVLTVIVGIIFCFTAPQFGPIAVLTGFGLILGGQIASCFQDIRYNALCETAIRRHEARMRQKHRQSNFD
ncbi:MAG: hypothetical protein KDA65_01270 [Planctomycetaceae bacterium]|nr:hypothetical protein [Planctomycetaceae bacterium]